MMNFIEVILGTTFTIRTTHELYDVVGLSKLGENLMDCIAHSLLSNSNKSF